MVESTITLDAVFGCLADSTRRDILKRISKRDLAISEIAKPYAMSFAGIAKHVAVLEKARLITKRRSGKEQIVSTNPNVLRLAAAHLLNYEKAWKERYDKLESLLNKKGK